MTTILKFSRVARPLLTAIVLAAISGCAVPPSPRSVGMKSGYDAKQVQFDNPGPHQIDVYSDAPDSNAKDAHAKRIHLKIYLYQDPNNKHHFKVTHKPEEDEDTN